MTPAELKAAIVRSWNSVAPQWNEWTTVVDDWFEPATRRMLAALDLRSGNTVLELAAGSGAFTRYLAEAVGIRGRVIATDSGPEMVRLAAENARRAGWTQVETRVMDADLPDVIPAAVDAVACRQGFMFLSNPARALGALRPTLRPGGRIAVSVFSTPDRSPVIAMPMDVLWRYTTRAGAPPPAPGGPGPFSLGQPGQLAGLFRAARFSEVQEERVACPLRIPNTPDLVRFFREIILGKLDDLPPEARAKAVAELTERSARLTEPGGPGTLSELLVVSGRQSA